MRMIRELPSSRSEYHKMAQELGKYVEDSDIIELNVLVPLSLIHIFSGTHREAGGL